MKAADDKALPIGCRWIRPAGGGSPAAGELRARDLDRLSDQLLSEARRRVAGLAAVERDLEERIRSRWKDAEAEIQRRLSSGEEELAASRRKMDADLKEGRLRAEKEGRASGYREGFARGREEGYRLGFEEGRREGLREGREEEGRRLEGELSGSAAALASAALELERSREDLRMEARKHVLDLAVEIAKRVLKREVARVDDSVLRNVEHAVELIFRRGAITIQVNPADATVVEGSLSKDPRWAQGFDCVEVRPAPDVSPGGCRLVSGSGSVDMTIETQLSLIEAALEGAEDGGPSPEPDGEARVDALPSGAPATGDAAPGGIERDAAASSTEDPA